MSEENIQRLAPEKYHPIEEDVLHVRLKSVGIKKFKFEHANQEFLLVLVGGQRVERKKWNTTFHNVLQFVYVSSLVQFKNLATPDCSDYFKEDLECFGKFANEKPFNDKKILLILNMEDAFEEAVQRYDFKKATRYEGKSDHISCMEFLIQKFTEQVQGDKKRLTVKIISAFNTKHIQSLIDHFKN